MERELARWDGSHLTIDTGPYLERPPGPVMCTIGTGQGTPLDWTFIHQPMARMPQPGDLLQLVAAAAAAWSRRDRILLVIRVRALDENEARAAWGDR